MNLVKILSHEQEYMDTSKEEKKDSKGTPEKEKVPVEAHALTIKQDCIESLLDICTEVRPQGFLEFSAEHSAMYIPD